MKNLYFILIVFVLTGCGGPPTSNTDYKNIIGKPFKMGELEIAQHDFPETMLLKDAFLACEALGDGWRLPTHIEINDIYENKAIIGGFAFGEYLTSGGNSNRGFVTRDFTNGGRGRVYDDQNVKLNIRAVRGDD
jgi:type II secretory pathway pseudopilin PulG